MGTIESGDLEAAILALERQVFRLNLRLEGVEKKRVPAAEQSLLQLWRALGDAASIAVPYPGTVSGTFTGCGYSFAGATVTITDHGSGAPVATLTTDSTGFYTGTVSLSGPTQSCDFTATPTGPYASRYVSPGTSTATLTAGTSTGVPITVAPATGYACTGICPYALPKTLFLTDSIVGGPFTLTYNTSLNRYDTATLLYNFPGGGGCAAQTNVQVAYRYVAGLVSVFYSQFAGLCPRGGGGTLASGPAATMLDSCGPFGSTGTTGTSLLYAGGAATITITE